MGWIFENLAAKRRRMDAEAAQHVEKSVKQNGIFAGRVMGAVKNG